MSPLFISFEGVDGAGKTTQIAKFCDYLTDQKVNFIQTREPGGTEVGKAIRKLLLEGDGEKLDALSELLLFSADRHEHIRTKISPALSNNQWVITDRFADSTRVFQSAARGLELDTVTTITDLAVGKIWPDLTFILDMPYEAALARKGVQAAEGLTETRFENEGAAFHKKIRQGFLDLAAERPKRCKIIDADATPEEVHTRIVDALNSYLNTAAA